MQNKSYFRNTEIINLMELTDFVLMFQYTCNASAIERFVLN